LTGIAIVGVGGWGQNHARVLAFLRAEGLINEVYVVDINENRAKLIAKRFGHKWTTKYEEILEKDSVEGIILATPTKLHYEQAKQALVAGKHVLVEKPMTENSKQAEELVKIAAENKLVLMVGFLLRYSPATRYVKKNLTKIGRPLVVSAKRTSLWPNRPHDVGVIRDLAIHDIDLIRYILETNPLMAYASGGAIAHDYEDYVAIFLKYGSEKEFISALIEANWLTPYKIRRMEITGSKAVFVIDYSIHKVTILSEDGICAPNIPYEEPLMSQDRNFVKTIIGEDRPLVMGMDGLIALKTCEAALQSMEAKKIIQIKA